MINENIIKNSSVDMGLVQKLSTNFIDIISDCEGLDDFSLRNALQDRYPLAYWLMQTSFASEMRRRSTNPQIFHRSSKEGVAWEMDIPGAVWTLEPSNQGTDCCWTLPDFAKCSGSVPLYMLCLKDCDNIFDRMVFDRLRINDRTDLAGIARSGETLEEVNERIRKLWFTFYLMHTAILGTSDTSDNIVKPFHGLLEVLQNEAVISLAGANPLAAFESLACRLAVLEGRENFVLATHPLIYESLDEMIVPDERGQLPRGWARGADGLTYKGMRFIQDKLVPVDLANGTGDIYVLAGDSVGAFFAFDMATPYEIRDDYTEQTLADGCGQMCTYLYNYGTVASNNANRVAVISGVPISSACTEIYDLAGLINPKTLIPAV